jgi:hypothetical protein
MTNFLHQQVHSDRMHIIIYLTLSTFEIWARDKNKSKPMFQMKGNTKEATQERERRITISTAIKSSQQVSEMHFLRKGERERGSSTLCSPRAEQNSRLPAHSTRIAHCWKLMIHGRAVRRKDERQACTFLFPKLCWWEKRQTPSQSVRERDDNRIRRMHRNNAAGADASRRGLITSNSWGCLGSWAKVRWWPRHRTKPKMRDAPRAACAYCTAHTEKRKFIPSSTTTIHKKQQE